MPCPEVQNQFCLQCTQQGCTVTQQHSNTSRKTEGCTATLARQSITVACATHSGHLCRVRRKCPSGCSAGSLRPGVSQKPRGPWPPPTLCPPLSSASFCPGRFCQPWNAKTLTPWPCCIFCCAVLCCAVQKQAIPLKGLLAVSCIQQPMSLLWLAPNLTWRHRDVSWFHVCRILRRQIASYVFCFKAAVVHCIMNLRQFGISVSPGWGRGRGDI